MSLVVTGTTSAQSMEYTITAANGANRMFLLTGIVKFSLKGTGSSWAYDTLSFEVGSVFPAGAVKDVQVVLGLANIYNQDTAKYAGWSIESMSGAYNSTQGRVVVSSRLGVRDVDGYTGALTYHVYVQAKV